MYLFFHFLILVLPWRPSLSSTWKKTAFADNIRKDMITFVFVFIKAQAP